VPRLTVYLAGPYNNCNNKQRTEWRKHLKAELAPRGYSVIDPADHTTHWTPLKEMVDIVSSDLLIANMWRESVGTTLGVHQAATAGKPVILIDPNYIGSGALRDLVGEDNVVHSLEAAINKLENEIGPQLLLKPIDIEKQHANAQPFKRSKLQASLTRACTNAQIHGSPLPVLVSHKVLTRMRSIGAPTIKSQDITRLVFEELNKLVLDPDRRYKQQLQGHAEVLQNEWQKIAEKKNDQRALDELSLETANNNARLEALIRENRDLRAERHKNGDSEPATQHFATVSEALQAAASRFSSCLVFDTSEKAVKSAKDCPFKRPDDIYEALDLLAQYAGHRRVVDNTTEAIRLPGLKEWLQSQQVSIDYAPTEAASTRANPSARAERTVMYQGRTFVLYKHFKFGKGNPNDCCRIHFELLDEEFGYRILIGHVGRHLST